MKLQYLFFKSFFYPFLAAVFLSTLIVTIFLGFFTNNYLNKRTSQNIINLEKKHSKYIINSVNDMVYSLFFKYEASLNEQILFYQKIANELLKNENSHQLLNDYLVSAIDVTSDENFCWDYFFESEYMGVWVLDENSTNENIYLDDSKKEARLQITAYSNTIPNTDSIFIIGYPYVYPYFFYFEKTELYITFPLSHQCDTGYIYELTDSSFYHFTSCLTEKGEYQPVFKMRCENFFINMLKSKTNVFDNNYLSNQNRTIFINNYYYTSYIDSLQDLMMCIKFDDPITNGNAYACLEALYNNITTCLDELNSKLKGYFLISNVGANYVFYYPFLTTTGKIPTEYIFGWDLDYKLEEKVNFYYHIKKIFSSNYIDYIGDTITDEIYVNGKNSSGQYFYANGIKYKYSLYPIVLINLNGKKEHILSTIYIYDEQKFFEDLEKYGSSLVTNIILELIIFIGFGSGLLYLIYLCFNILAKYIVIPIKNVNYMLKGINIGGDIRMKYLDFLRKTQDENIEKLEQYFLNENKRNNLNKEINNGINNNENNLSVNNNLINMENGKEQKNESVIISSDFNKIYDEESEYIEKEYNFHDFDDQFLYYRPLEIELLFKPLLDIKRSFILTSEDRQQNQIINYSYSEEIFKKFKNREGTIICESNIGNLQSQLLEFDKAIYHLAVALQDNKLKRFLSRNISDELDESDFLLRKISYFFNKQKRKENNNLLSKKQINSTKDIFSKKIIGILINTRYCRLIHAYYMFFKNLQKLQNSNKNIIQVQYINTLFHTINYYHKIIIQFIFLSFEKNDLVKIGEGILDYIEFLVKFKFKTSLNDQNFLDYNNIYNPEYSEKIDFKKNIFNKIVKWFDLFEEYISYIKDNSSLHDLKSIIDEYLKGLNSDDNNKLNIEGQSALMFRINLQRYVFLKGKFCLYCKNYSDALFFFIKAAKVNSIVIDGLIQKRSLKHIYKLVLKLQNQFEIAGLNDSFMEKEIKESTIYINRLFGKKINKKRSLKLENEQTYKDVKFRENIKHIKKNILKDISECNAKKEKDILILIDFNIYNNNKEENLYNKTYKIDTFIEQTLLIINNYLSPYDRL